jgi:nitrate/nitrite transport system ATP-binding protein
MSFLEAHGISKTYTSTRGRTEVLGNINLSVNHGEFVAIVGYSGSGKTTLLSILAGLVTPDTGRVLLDGKVMERPGPERGIVFQTYSLLPWLTAYGNVYLAVDQVFGSWTQEQKHAHTERFLAMVNLTAARDKRPSQLSGGMRQRISVARALAADPTVLLMDEPLSALDALTRATLQTEIETIWRESRKTVVLITNDVDEALLLADRIIPMTAGPRATLGPSFDVDIERPRDRRAVNHDVRFTKLRAEIIRYLLANGGRRSVAPRAEPVAMPVVEAALEVAT